MNTVDNSCITPFVIYYLLAYFKLDSHIIELKKGISTTCGSNEQ